MKGLLTQVDTKLHGAFVSVLDTYGGDVLNNTSTHTVHGSGWDKCTKDVVLQLPGEGTWIRTILTKDRGFHKYCV